MHKKLEQELLALAQSILQMDDSSDVLALKEKARIVYEKLSILAYINNKTLTKPSYKAPEKVTFTDESAKQIDPQVEETVTEEENEFFKPEFDSVRIDIESLKTNQISSKEEFRGSVSADKTASLFDSLEKMTGDKQSLNDRLVKNTIQIGLNDRLAFVKHLFNSDQSDFNRVISQLNSFNTEKEAKDFIFKTVKPDYNWTGKEDYEERLLAIIERKFL
jgi:hypothetical protein